MEAGVVGAIAEQVKLAQLASRIIKAPAEPPHVYYVAEDGTSGITLRKETAIRPAARQRASSIETLVEWVRKSDKESEIWYSRKAVVCGDDVADPQSDNCTLSLSPSPQLTYLAAVQTGGASFTQSQFIKLLRTTMFGANGGDLLASVRKVNLQKAKTVNAEQQKGKVSLNRSDIAEMSGANDIPDVIGFDVPIFSAANIPARTVVQCDLDLNADTEQFVLTVLPGEIEKAFAKGEAWLLNEIMEQVGKDEIAIYFGEPGCA